MFVATTDHNSVGAGATPKLGKAPFGAARPGNRGGHQAKAAPEKGSVTQTRPGGAQSTAGASSKGDVTKTRPGGVQSAASAPKR